MSFSNRWCIVLVVLLIEFVLSAPQGYNYYSYQQRINAQRAQSQRLQAQRAQAQNRYRQQNYNPNRVSRADSENAKFLGVQNQESAEQSGKTLNLIRRKKQFAFGGGNPCYYRSADQPAEGRFLWDFNVYNVYPQSYGGGNGCNGGGYGSRPFGGGFFQNFLSLFVPGGALNQNVAPLRPLQSNIQSDSTGSGGLPAGVQNDYDPNLDGTGTGGSTGSVSSSGNLAIGGGGAAPGLTPGQLVGGVATTVNGIIQQLTGNRPVYRGYG